MDKKPSNVSEEYPGCNAAETSERPPLFITIKERNALLIESVVLTEDEIKEAIIEGKRKKYFHNKHKAYWDDQDKTINRQDRKIQDVD